MKKINLNKIPKKNLLNNIFSDIIIILFFSFFLYLMFKDIPFLNLIDKKIVFIIFLFIIIFILLIINLLIIINKQKAKIKLNKGLKKIKILNPFKYFREIPNDYGIGVSTILLDSTIENEKDIVAVILDLCARKYLKLQLINNQFVINVLKGIDENLLQNEKYILNLIVNNNLKYIDYNVWYNYCLEDGKKLNLFDYSKENNDEVYYQNNVYLMLTIKICFTIIFLISLLSFIFASKIFAIILVIYLLIVNYIVLNSINKDFGKVYYIGELNNYIKRTKKGIKEYQKLLAFKSFIKDFGNFVSKKPEEVVLWDRYLSYAHVFGLTKEIMKTGYKKLIDNASFKIDDIANINLSNIEIK